MLPSGYVKKGWCQGSYARDINGVVCLETSPLACYWCLVGSSWASLGDGTITRVQQGFIIRECITVLRGSTVLEEPFVLYSWQDEEGRTREEVLKVLEEAEKRVLGVEKVL